MGINTELLRFRCTGCGNCCRDPLLPLTCFDLRRLVAHTSLRPDKLVRWCSPAEIDLADEPENFVILPVGLRVMTLRHHRGRCLFLDRSERCSIYDVRPLGCRVFPFDTQFRRDGTLRRLELIAATECPYELSGRQKIDKLRATQQAFEDEVTLYHGQISAFNQVQKQRKRANRALLRPSDFFGFLGLS